MKSAPLSLIALVWSQLGVIDALTSTDYKDLKVLGEDRCTTIAIGREATTDGSTMCTDTMDCADCDWRLGKLPAKDYPEGAMRPVYAESSQYPRYIRDDRGPTWSKANLESKPEGLKDMWVNEKTAILGYIPQVAHTYAVLEGEYGFMNEHQVSMGESTCAAKLFAGPIGWNDGKALLNIGELMQIGMERAKTAREAIQIMGDVATTYGFYGESYDPIKYGAAYVMGEAGEGLSVIDPHEAWIFHILPDDTASSAVWVAQRVPDSHVAVVANSYVIRDVVPNSEDFMYSENLWEVATRMGFWNENEDKLLDFKKVYSPERYHPDYSNNRVWRVFSLANPSAKLPMVTDADADDYPFSMPVDHLLSLQDVIAFNRDQYEGTPLSLTEGMAAGPFGDPNRYQNNAYGSMTIWDTLEGAFPRPISLFRTSTSIVSQSRSHVPNDLARVWVSAYAPDMSSYTPMYVQTTDISTHWTTGSMHAYDSEVAWWNFAVVGNYVARYYHFAVKSVRELQEKLQTSLDEDCLAIEKKVMKMLEDGDKTEKEKITSLLTEFTVKKGDEVSVAWKELFPVLLATYRDGFVISGKETAKDVTLTAMFYPKWWLDAVGYFDAKPNPDPAAILFASKPEDADLYVTNSVSFSSLIMSCFACSLVFGLSGYYVAKTRSSVTGESAAGGSGEVISQFTQFISSKHNAYSGSHRGYSSIDSSEL